MNRFIFRGLVAALLLLVSLSVPGMASADSGSIVWTLTGMTFDDGGTASGSFDYNAATNTYSNVDITTTGGTTLLSGATYTTFFGVSFGDTSSSTGLLLGAPGPDLMGPMLFLMFSAPLTDAGGIIPLVPGGNDPTNGIVGSGENDCTATDCSTTGPVRFVTKGDVSGTVVTPEPTALSLLGVGLVALLAGAAIRKASQA